MNCYIFDVKRQRGENIVNSYAERGSHIITKRSRSPKSATPFYQKSHRSEIFTLCYIPCDQPSCLLLRLIPNAAPAIAAEAAAARTIQSAALFVSPVEVAVEELTEGVDVAYVPVLLVVTGVVG